MVSLALAERSRTECDRGGKIKPNFIRGVLMATKAKNMFGSETGVVKAISGSATVTDSHGITRELHIGDVVSRDETVSAANGATVHIEFSNGGFATLGGGDALHLSESIFSQVLPTGTVKEIQTTAIDASQAKLAAGVDPSDVLEATAAAGASGGGSDEGSNFVVVAQHAARGNVTPGFETDTFGYPVHEETVYDGRLVTSPADHTTEPLLEGFTERIVMYATQVQLAGADTFAMTAYAQAKQHTVSGIVGASENGYGVATVDAGGRLVYTMSEAGKTALVASADGYILDYVVYKDSNGVQQVVQVVLTKDSVFDTNDPKYLHTVEGETHYSFVPDAVAYNVNSTEGGDVLEFGQFNGSFVTTNRGSDDVIITGGSKDSTIALGANGAGVDMVGACETNTLTVSGEMVRTQVYGTAGREIIDVHGGMNASRADLGGGDNLVNVSRSDSRTADDGFAVKNSVVTAGDGQNAVTVTIDAMKASGDIIGLHAEGGVSRVDLSAGTAGRIDISADQKTSGKDAYGVFTDGSLANAESSLLTDAKGSIHIRAEALDGGAYAFYGHANNATQAQTVISGGDVTLSAHSTLYGYALIADDKSVTNVTASGTLKLEATVDQNIVVPTSVGSQGLSLNDGAEANLRAHDIDVSASGYNGAYAMITYSGAHATIVSDKDGSVEVKASGAYAPNTTIGVFNVVGVAATGAGSGITIQTGDLNVSGVMNYPKGISIGITGHQGGDVLVKGYDGQSNSIRSYAEADYSVALQGFYGGKATLQGGDGKDTITLTAVSKTSDARAISVENGAVILSAGKGDDAVTISGSSNNGGNAYGIYCTNHAANTTLVDLGNGNNTLDISASGSGNAYGILNQHADASKVRIVGGSGNDAITITAASGVGKTSAGVQNATIETGAGDDIITITATGGTSTGTINTVIDLGTGKDMVSLTGGTGMSGGKLIGTGDNIGDTFTIIGTKGAGMQSSAAINAGDGDDVITVSGTTYGMNNATINAGEGDNHVTVTGGTGGAMAGSSITAGSGDDIITLKGGGANVDSTIMAGLGSDTVIVNGSATNHSTIALGTTLTAADILGDTDHNHLTINGSLTNSKVYGTAGIDEVTLAGKVTGSLLEGGAGYDTLHLDAYQNNSGQTNLSLSKFTGADGNILHGFEILDFKGANSNTVDIDTLFNVLQLDRLDITQMSNASGVDTAQLASADALRVTGDAGDKVNLHTNNGEVWAQEGSVTYQGTAYNVYHDTANNQYVLIDQHIQSQPVI